MFRQAWPQVRILGRGDVENRIKEHKLDLKADPSASRRTGRISCHRFLANKKASEGGQAPTTARKNGRKTWTEAYKPNTGQGTSRFRHNYKTYSQLVQGYLWQ